MHVQAKGKEVESLSNIMKQKDDLIAQKQRQIDSLLAAIGARPAAAGAARLPPCSQIDLQLHTCRHASPHSPPVMLLQNDMQRIPC